MIIVLARYQLLEHTEEAGDVLSDLGGTPGHECLDEADQRVDVSRPLPEHGHQEEGEDGHVLVGSLIPANSTGSVSAFPAKMSWE